MDEKQSRLFGYLDDPGELYRCLSLYVEYLVRVDNVPEIEYKSKKLNLLTGESIRTEDQLVRWNKELGLLKAAEPDRYFPVMPVKSGGNRMCEILETQDWIKMYYFYES